MGMLHRYTNQRLNNYKDIAHIHLYQDRYTHLLGNQSIPMHHYQLCTWSSHSTSLSRFGCLRSIHCIFCHWCSRCNYCQKLWRRCKAHHLLNHLLVPSHRQCTCIYLRHVPPGKKLTTRSNARLLHQYGPFRLPSVVCWCLRKCSLFLFSSQVRRWTCNWRLKVSRSSPAYSSSLPQNMQGNELAAPVRLEDLHILSSVWILLHYLWTQRSKRHLPRKWQL